MNLNMKITPAKIKTGDVLVNRDGIQPMWVAQGDAHIHDSRLDTVVTVRVMHIPDGGIDVRAWTIDSTSEYHVIDVTDEAMEQIREACSSSLVNITRVIRFVHKY